LAVLRLIVVANLVGVCTGTGGLRRGIAGGRAPGGFKLDFNVLEPYILLAKPPPCSELPPYGVRARSRRE
jgi:hypothetical protein